MMRIAKVSIMLLFLWGYWMLLMWWTEPAPPPPPSRPEFSDEERAYVTARLKYHGIERAELDQATGERFFWRDGQRCRL